MNSLSSPACSNRTWAREPGGLKIAPHTSVDWTPCQQQTLRDDVDFCHPQERALITYQARNEVIGRFSELLGILEADESPVPTLQDVAAWEEYVDKICRSQDRLPHRKNDQAVENSALGRYGE